MTESELMLCPSCGEPLRQVGSKGQNTCWACDYCGKDRNPNFNRKGLPIRIIDMLRHKVTDVEAKEKLTHAKEYLQKQLYISGGVIPSQGR